MNGRLLIVTVTLGLGVAGCRQERASPTSAAEKVVAATEQVSAVRVAGGIEIANGSADVITFVVSNRGWLGLLASCADPQVACTKLAPGQGIVVKEADIHGSDAGTFREALVSYWRIVGGQTEELAREIVVPM